MSEARRLDAGVGCPYALALHADDPTTYYGGGAKGYTDYPTLAQERGEVPKPCIDDRWR